jgi:hypothetical protein
MGSACAGAWISLVFQGVGWQVVKQADHGALSLFVYREVGLIVELGEL